MALQAEGTAWVFGDDINTDLVMPGSVFLAPVAEQATACLSAVRPGWSALVKPGDVLVAGGNFGLGSSRPIGRVFAELQISGVVAETFNSLGLRNCVNYGVHVLPCPGIREAVTDGERVAVDWREGILRNLDTGVVIAGNPVPQTLLDIAEQGGVIEVLRVEGLLESAD